LLASFPQLGDSGQILEASFGADLLVEPYDAELGKLLHESVGEKSTFMRAQAIMRMSCCLS
jgi:hypothetical protein